jgi:hypothetical protein
MLEARGSEVAGHFCKKPARFRIEPDGSLPARLLMAFSTCPLTAERIESLSFQKILLLPSVLVARAMLFHLLHPLLKLGF